MTIIKTKTKRATGILASMGLLVAMVSTGTLAAETRTLNQTYAYNGQSVNLDMDIGSAKFIATDNDEIKIEVIVEGADTNWLFFWGDTDLDAVSIESTATASEITLTLSEQDNIEQQWIVYLPKQAALSLEVGIGDIEVTGLSSNIDIALGIGSARVEHQTLFNTVELGSGIGEVSISEQGKHLAVTENLVAQSYSNKNLIGESTLSVDVGVGEIVVVKL
ncbi:hypothetical protein CXF83_07270 [Shewanella sp. Choline-02u-19]|uniref:hypothetical protein n=1 Tax=unclassified Shewanella TaxID=196818 RepID=UPI000C33AEFD|nr:MULTISPECIES: hypothetical protein [unclassified Shewanella]PKG75125.1 hypothetical protein CXF86_09060 [Shewanella sp. GutCb]PKH58482.1 hypothetical protein CXF84_05560 [Shewanella sp. Bg11-22]PKI26555.1 hypothetical protein CXF83_07270 [Shewanella sp. Choline-02u-19]